MSDGKRRAVLAVAVSDAKPLAYLGGALNGARDFSKWAFALGYETRLLTDEKDPVTFDRLRIEMEDILEGEPIHRFIIYFAGHGLIREAEEGLWLLSDWYTKMRAVAVEVLKRRLYWYGIKQLTIFADACRSLPTDIYAADLAADPLLGRGPQQPTIPPAIDKFIAAQDGVKTYMITGQKPENDRCLFSGVLLQGLWGARTEAFSGNSPNKVTSQSLAAYLQGEVPKIAQRYDLNVIPSVLPTFPPGDDVYYDLNADPSPPSFPDWPPAHTSTQLGVLTASEPASDAVLLDQLRNQDRPDRHEIECGFASEGSPVKAIWTSTDISAKRLEAREWWRIGPTRGSASEYPIPILIEYEDDCFAALTILPSFFVTILREPRGVTAVIYREIHCDPGVAAATEDAIAEMEAGALRADRATDLAVALRQLKHFDPVRGVLSAYLYDSISDIESICRMASFYVQEGQPIPYDIALLAGLKCELDDGRLYAHVPAISARRPRTEAEEHFTWTHSTTPKGIGLVGGLWPWMRQGWAFLDEVEAVSNLVLPNLSRLTSHLRPARFTTLDAFGGRALADRLRLRC